MKIIIALIMLTITPSGQGLVFTPTPETTTVVTVKNFVNGVWVWTSSEFGDRGLKSVYTWNETTKGKLNEEEK